MDWLREAPANLTKAQLSLETVEGFTPLEALKWNEQAKKWTINFQIVLSTIDADHPLRITEWYLTVEETYPLGSINVYPAKENGITDTYPHQIYNDVGRPDLPWRTGEICTSTQAKLVGRSGYDIEPYTIDDRLLWHCKRAMDWILCASKGELLLPGEPFELPHTPPSCESSESIRFSEGTFAASPWSSASANFGRARLFNLRTDDKVWFVDFLMGPKNAELVRNPWGQSIRRQRGKTWDGAWLRLEIMPTVKPYRFPETWGELKQALSDQNVPLRNLLASLTRVLRDGEIHFLLIGFPVPEIEGDPPAIIHWVCVGIPALSTGEACAKGFRPNEQGLLQNDMQTRFLSRRKLHYLPTQNWHPDQIRTRGRFQGSLRGARIAMIGCGALGAPIAEMLIRGGVEQITLFDGDDCEIGNLTRHTLSMDDIGKPKAVQLAHRLNALNPHAEVAPHPSKVSFADESASQLLLEHDLIVECTGEDELLHVLAGITFPQDVRFCSVSIGFQAKRMFIFHAKDESFPVDDYMVGMSDWLEAEKEEFEGEHFPREGIGCFHPVFPARCDDMWLWASLAVKSIAASYESTDSLPVLHVYEQNQDQDGSISIRRAKEVPVHG